MPNTIQRYVCIPVGLFALVQFANYCSFRFLKVIRTNAATGIWLFTFLYAIYNVLHTSYTRNF